MTKQRLFLNASPANHNFPVNLEIQKNSFNDDGQGTITFKNRLTITDGTEQWNGTRYDIDSMDVSEFRNKLTVNHSQEVEGVVGIVTGLQKRAGKVTIDGIKFAINESSMARFVYNMIREGYLTDFSIESMGPWPDEEGVYYNSKLVGLSVVAYGNNRSAFINEIAINSVREAKAANPNIDTSLVEKNYICYDENQAIAETQKKQENEMFKFVKNTRTFAVTLKYKNSQGEETEVTINPGKGVEVPEGEAAGVEKQITDAQEPKVEAPAQPQGQVDVAEVVKQAIAPLAKQLNELEQKKFDNSAQEPMFTKSTNSKAQKLSSSVSKELDAMNYEEIHEIQINSIMDLKKYNGGLAADRLYSANSYFLDKLKEAGKIKNSITLDDMGNFVISPELLTTIEGFRSNYQSLISRLNIKDTLSLQMAWLKRNGDVNMQEVGFCEGDTPSNLKPISEYDFEFNSSNLKEVAAVTPVCDAATRFAAVDLLTDVAEGYRTDFDRKRAEIFIARLQQAVDSTGKTKTYATTSDVNALKSFILMAAAMQQNVMGGTYILSQASYWELMSRQLGAGINTDDGFKIFTTGDNGPLMLGAPYIIVPNELLPTLNTAETRTFVVDGANVTINQAVFFVDLTTYAGRTSGGLKYDMSTEAAYEVNGTVKSAFQRDELLLRGFFFRGGAVKDEDKVVGLGSRGVS